MQNRNWQPRPPTWHYLHRVPKKTKQICFCQNFVKFPPISIIFGRKMGNDPNICEVHSFSPSPNLRHHLTVLNANVPNCYITPKLLVIDRSHWRPGELHIFTDEKVFTVAAPTYSQNDRFYVRSGTRKKDVDKNRLLRTRPTFSKSVMVSVGVRNSAVLLSILSSRESR